MAVPSVSLDMNMNELRKAFYSIANQPSLQILVLAGLGCLQQDLAQPSTSANKPPATPGCSLMGAIGETSPEIKFGSLFWPAPSDTSSHGGQHRRPRGHDAQTISAEFYQKRRAEHKALRETCQELASELKLDYKASCRMKLQRLRDYTRDLQRRQAVARAAAEKTAAQKAADNAAAQAAAEKNAAASKPAATPEEPSTQLGLNITQPATTPGSTCLATNSQNVMPVLGVPDSPPVNDAAASKTAGPGSPHTPSPEEGKQVTKTKGAEWHRDPLGRLTREVPNQFAVETTRWGLSEVLGRVELTAEDRKDISAGFTHRYDCVLEYLEEGQVATTGTRLSLEAMLRVRHQLVYFLSAEHLENNAHARSLYKSNGERFYVKDFMSWPSMAGLTEMEVINVCQSLTDEWEDYEIGLCISTDSYEESEEMTEGEESETTEEFIFQWWELTDEERASANLREVFVMSDRCKSFFMRSEAAIRSEL